MRATVIKLSTNSASKKVFDMLNEQGLTYPTGFNKVAPELPDDITLIDDDKLMKLFSSYTEYSAFLLMQISAARIDEETSDKKLQVFEAEFIAKAPKGETVAKTKAIVMAQPEFTALQYDADVARHYRTLVESIQQGVEEGTKVVSREITRRKQAMF